MNDLKVMFFGTPEIAAAALKGIVGAGYNVVGAVSQPDKPQGRKMILTPTAVHAYCDEAKIPCYQPATIKDEALLPLLKKLSPDVIVVIAYGKIFPKYLLDFPKYGCINIHGSLLPKYRGAAPIQWSVINGEKQSGMTTMFMSEGMDEGDVIKRYPIDIGESETAGELFERMAALGAEAILDTLSMIPDLPRTAQESEQVTYAPLLDKEMAELDFGAGARDVYNKIRGLNPWPVAYTYFGGKKLKIYRAEMSGAKLDAWCALGAKDRIEIGCCDGAIAVTELALEGGRRMSASEFLAGHAINEKIDLRGNKG